MAPVDRNSNSSLALQRRRNPRRPQDFRSGVSTAWNTLTTVRTVIASYVLVISHYKDDVVVLHYAEAELKLSVITMISSE